MSEIVSDEDNPMLLHKPKQKSCEPDIYGRDIPIRISDLTSGFVKQKSTFDKVVDRVTGADGKLAPVIKVFLPGTKGWTPENKSDDPRGLGFFIGIKGTF